jgi:hypothetical protein
MGTEATKSNDKRGHETVIARHRLPLFPAVGRNFVGCGRLSIEKMGGHKEETMHGLIYLVGLIVVILAILSFFGLR